jgi:hypothetical protein
MVTVAAVMMLIGIAVKRRNDVAVISLATAMTLVVDVNVGMVMHLPPVLM